MRGTSWREQRERGGSDNTWLLSKIRRFHYLYVIYNHWRRRETKKGRCFRVSHHFFFFTFCISSLLCMKQMSIIIIISIIIRQFRGEQKLSRSSELLASTASLWVNICPSVFLCIAERYTHHLNKGTFVPSRVWIDLATRSVVTSELLEYVHAYRAENE